MAVFDDKGKGPGWTWRIVSEKPYLTKALIKEINARLKDGRRYLVRDLKADHKRRNRVTNPFAWS